MKVLRKHIQNRRYSGKLFINQGRKQQKNQGNFYTHFGLKEMGEETKGEKKNKCLQENFNIELNARKMF